MRGTRWPRACVFGKSAENKDRPVIRAPEYVRSVMSFLVAIEGVFIVWLALLLGASIAVFVIWFFDL